LVLSAVVHNGLLHLLANMLAFVPIAAALERQLGSLRIAYFIFIFLLIGDVIYLTCSGLLE
jgi:membrane associated rhomboid family serine protease